MSQALIAPSIWEKISADFDLSKYDLIWWIVNSCAKCNNYQAVRSIWIESKTNPDEQHLFCPIHGVISDPPREGDGWIDWLGGISG